MTPILKLKGVTQSKNEIGDLKRDVPCDNNVIYIQQKVDNGACGMKNEERAICQRSSEPQMKQMECKSFKPGSRSLFQSIE